MLKVLRCKKILVACERFQGEVHGRKIYKHLPAKRGNPPRHLFGSCSTPFPRRENIATESKIEQKNMKGSRMLDLGEMMRFETLQGMGARNIKWQKTHHAARSSGIEEHGYRKSEDFTFDTVGERSGGS